MLCMLASQGARLDKDKRQGRGSSRERVKRCGKRSSRLNGGDRERTDFEPGYVLQSVRGSTRCSQGGLFGQLASPMTSTSTR